MGRLWIFVVGMVLSACSVSELAAVDELDYEDEALPALVVGAESSDTRILPARVGYPIRMGAARTTSMQQAWVQLVGSSRVELRTLILTAGLNDFGLPTARAMLDQVGAPYQVVNTQSQNLTEALLVNPDGSGRFQAIVLTNNLLVTEDEQPTFSQSEWELLWEYQRKFSVRSVSLFTNPTAAPDDFCLVYKSEKSYENSNYSGYLTLEAQNFLGLKAGAKVQLRGAYVYKTALKPGCNAQALLQDSKSNVLAVLANSEGLERLGLTFATDPDTVYTQVFLTGMLRWMTRGVFVGEHRKFIHVDNDDWGNTNAIRHSDGTIAPTPYRLSADHVNKLVQRQQLFRQTYAGVLSGFRLHIAYNGDLLDPQAPPSCDGIGSSEPLSSVTRCYGNEFYWINHTFTHLALNFTNYQNTREEIELNLQRANQLGLEVPRSVLKTGEYSGWGHYATAANPEPRDRGLSNSNPNLIQAMKDLGVRYAHANMSVRSHQPNCFNCVIYHPLDPAVVLVPDWTVDIGYHVSVPSEATSFYNSQFGPTGSNPIWTRDLTYSQLMETSTDTALVHILSGSVYSHTFHQPNLKAFSGNRNLNLDWLERLFKKYTNLMSEPVANLSWTQLAQYAENRTQHIQTLGGVQAMWNRSSAQITLQPNQAGLLFLSRPSGSTQVSFAAGESKSFSAQ